MQRYDLEELRELLKGVVYDYLANDTQLFQNGKVVKEGKSIPRIMYLEKEMFKENIRSRIEVLIKERMAFANDTTRPMYDYSIDVLQKEFANLSCNSMTEQKLRFSQTGEVFGSHSYVCIPLNKKINALYDDFDISVAFFDDLTTNLNNICELEDLKSAEKRKKYVKQHIEITHICLTRTSEDWGSRTVGIEVLGNIKQEHKQYEEGNCSFLPSKFADFKNITLAECEEINNQDLKQIVQSRLDMDRENLELLAERVIRGDHYSLRKSRESGDIYIRYVCPSTQRPYHDLIDKRYLAESQYFDEDNYDSYLLAWYSINNMFMELDEEALAMVSPRC